MEKVVELIRRACKQSNHSVAEWIVKNSSDNLEEEMPEIYSQAIEAKDIDMMEFIDSLFDIDSVAVPGLPDKFCRAVTEGDYRIALQILRPSDEQTSCRFDISEVPEFIDVYKAAVQNAQDYGRFGMLIRIGYRLNITHDDVPEIIDRFREACCAEGQWKLIASDMVAGGLVDKSTATDVLYQTLKSGTYRDMCWLFDDYHISRYNFRDPLGLFRDSVLNNWDTDIVYRIGESCSIKRYEAEDLIRKLCEMMCKKQAMHIRWLVKSLNVTSADVPEGFTKMGASEYVITWAQNNRPDLV